MKYSGFQKSDGVDKPVRYSRMAMRFPEHMHSSVRDYLKREHGLQDVLYGAYACDKGKEPLFFVPDNGAGYRVDFDGDDRFPVVFTHSNNYRLNKDHMLEAVHGLIEKFGFVASRHIK